MAKYTTELRSICEEFAGFDESVGYSQVNEVISKSRSKVFNFDYPIFDEAYRSVLETKIIKHYYTREIGAETVGLWQMWLDTKMNEIMPYYNKLYETELMEFNPFYDADYTKTGNRDADKTGTEDENITHNSEKNGTGTITNDYDGTSTRTNNLTETTNMRNNGTETTNMHDEPIKETWDEFSDTPQGGLTGVRQSQYLTNARHITESGEGSTVSGTVSNDVTNSGTVANTGTVGDVADSTNIETRNTTDTEERKIDGTKTYNLNNTEEYLEHVVGKFPGSSYASLLKEYRDTFLNIDMMIIMDLRKLFMGLW